MTSVIGSVFGAAAGEDEAITKTRPRFLERKGTMIETILTTIVAHWIMWVLGIGY